MIIVIFWSLFIIAINEELVILPSRRLCNLSYIIWMVIYNMTLIIWFSGVDLMTETSTSPWIYQCIGGNSMLFFLAANLLTGLVNICLQPAILADNYAIPILISYTFVLFTISGKLKII